MKIDTLIEGFTSYTVSGSDMASDAMLDMCDAMAEALSKSFEKDGGGYNTPGFLNVAMIFHEYLLPGKFYKSGSSKLKSLAVRTLKALDRVQPEDFDNKQKLFAKSVAAYISKAH